MEDPVILSSGFTYERETIQKHFQVNGHFDPMTREKVDGATLTTNQNVKHATEEFVRNNPWAFEFFPGEDLDSVRM